MQAQLHIFEFCLFIVQCVLIAAEEDTRLTREAKWSDIQETRRAITNPPPPIHTPL